MIIGDSAQLRYSLRWIWLREKSWVNCIGIIAQPNT